MSGYPDEPGFKAEGPSQQAAQAVAGTAKTLRAAVVQTLIEARHDMTADEIADAMGRSILSIRPRVSELHRLGAIQPTGMRRRNASGLSATAWELAGPPTEQEAA